MFSTAPIDVLSGAGAWLCSYRYEPFLDRWFCASPDLPAEVGLLATADLPAQVAKAAVRAPDRPHHGAYRTPLKIQVQLNRHCNYACPICYAESFRGKASPDDPTLDQLDRLFSYLKDWGVLRVNFVGGDIFMRPDVAEIVALAQSCRLLVSCITNGRIAGQKISTYEPLLRSLWNVQVSCNGIGRSYESEYGMTGWEAAKQSITNVISVTRRNILSFVVTANNVGDIPEFLDFAAQIRPSIVKFGSICWSGRSADDGGKLYYRETLPLAKRAIAQGRRDHPDLKIQSQLDQGEDTPLWEEFLHGYRPFEFYFAPEGRDGMYLHAAGGIYPFPLLSDRDDFKVGNWKTDDLRGIWDDDPLLNRLRGVTFKSSACGQRGCSRVCGLWSRSHSISWTNTLDGKVPCELTEWA